MNTVQFFLLHHERLHFQRGGIQDRTRGLTAEQMRCCPHDLNSIAWLRVWCLHLLFLLLRIALWTSSPGGDILLISSKVSWYALLYDRLYWTGAALTIASSGHGLEPRR